MPFWRELLPKRWITSKSEMELLETAAKPSRIPGLLEKIRRFDESENDWAREMQYLSRAARECAPDNEFDVARSAAGRERNRYSNILANESTRVKLKGGGCDYINANFIRGAAGAKQYIAAQAPIPETIEDFWQMIWENRVTTVIMLTKLMEGNVQKAVPYWPSKGSCVYGDYKLRLTGSRNAEFGEVLALELSHDGSSFSLEHVQFTKWPDHGVPRTMDSFKALFAYLSTRQSEVVDPIVIHCSAGIGRSGTLIAIHWLLERERRGESLTVESIANAVKSLKEQRAGMVQTPEQYRFVHVALLKL